MVLYQKLVVLMNRLLFQNVEKSKKILDFIQIEQEMQMSFIIEIVGGDIGKL